MNRIFCTFITKDIREQAKRLNMDADILNNIISTMKSIANNAYLRPSDNDIKHYIENNKERAAIAELDLPIYDTIELKPNAPIVTIMNGRFKLGTFNDNISANTWYNTTYKSKKMIENAQEFDSPKAIYTFNLYLYKSLFENNQDITQLDQTTRDKYLDEAFDKMVKAKMRFKEEFKPKTNSITVNINGTDTTINYKIVPVTANNILAGTNSKTNEITIREGITTDEIRHYLNGDIKSKSSEQKKEVLKELISKGYDKSEIFKALENKENIIKMLLIHENSHVQHNDRAVYWKQGKDLMTLDKIAIETRATEDGLNSIGIYPKTNKNLNIKGIDFIKSTSSKYSDRTRENIEWSDITIALAENFDTAGEKLTKYSAEGKYVSSNITKNVNDIVDSIYNQMTALGKTKDIKLNIAGNGIYSLSKNQFQYDIKLIDIIKGLQNKGITISEIRTGGQTGIDEAGAKAGQYLGIKTTVNAPSKWTYRNKQGNDISDEISFKNRFEMKNKYVNHYTGNITNDGNTIFVFGSNPEGRHGAGSAKIAREQFGAHYGQGEGIQGNSYALPTKDLRIKANNGFRSISPRDIITNIQKMYETAKRIPSKQFKIAYRNGIQKKTLNGYTGEEMVSFFKAAGEMPKNVYISEEWFKFWNDVKPYDLSKDTAKIQGPIQIDISNEEKEDVPYIDAERNVKIDTESAYVKIARIFSTTEYTDRVNSIAREFSNQLDSIYDELIEQTEDEIANAENEEIKKQREQKLLRLKDTNGRKFAISEIGFSNIANNIKSLFSDILDYSDEEIQELYGQEPKLIREKVQNTLDYFDYLLEDACNYIEMNEGVRIVIDKENKDEDNSTIENTETENNNDEEQTGDNENGQAVSGNDGWSFKVREVDPHISISQGTKSVLRDIKRLRPDGSIDVDDLGFTRYVREDIAHATIINALSNMIDPNDFSRLENGNYRLLALERLAQKYTWVNQVIDKLLEDPKLISLFYTDFRKDFIPYWTQKFNEEKGVTETISLNQAVGVDSTMTDVIRNYESNDMMSNNSIYDSNGKIIDSNCDTGIGLMNKSFKLIQDFDEDNLDTIYNNINNALRMVGFNTSKNDISYLFDDINGKNNLLSLIRNLKEIFNKAKELNENDHLIENLKEQYTNIAELVGTVTELDNIQSFRNNGKTYYSYSAPNYVNTQIKKFLNDERRQEYLDKEFKAYNWFYDKENNKWKNEWLRQIESDSDVRSHIAIKEINTLDSDSYEDWKPNQIKSAFLTEYFSIPENKGAKKQYAWYNFPIFSDSPVAMFIRFTKQVTDNEGIFKQKLLPMFRQVIYQEIERIKLVENRDQSGIMKIQNFDKRGKLFNFFPELNTNKYYRTSDYEIFTKSEITDENRDYVNEYGIEMSFKEAINALSEDKDALDEFLNSAISEIMDNNYKEYLDSYNDRNLAQQLIDMGVATTQEAAMDKLEEYFWNQNFATSQIIQITTTDLAYYKNGVDFQKRYKEIYAAGSKLNINSKYGRQIERTIYIKDNIITSTNYLDIKKNIEQAVKEKRLSKEEALTILDKFKDINQTDAQAYRSLSSYRAMLDMMGLWTDDMQTAFEHLKEGVYDSKDFDIVWQTIKPFVYTQIDKNDGLGGHIKVPHQNKNSEFLLLAAYDILNNVMNKSPKFRAMNRFMEDNNIDVIQFESAVKAGGEGVIDINISHNKVDKVIKDQAIKLGDITIPLQGVKNWNDIKKAFDNALDEGNISQDDYNTVINYFEPTEDEVYNILQENTRQKVLSNDIINEDGYNTSVVHEIPYNDYVVQMPTPEHLFDASSIYGSQYRNLILSDMPEGMEITLNGRVLKAKNEKGENEIRKFYNSLIIENLIQDFNEIRGYFNSIQDLQKELMQMVKGNPKYGRDILNALQIVKRNINGHEVESFNIPLHNPSTTLKIQELVNSIFKNHITKQKIKGGKATLASNFGFRNDLRILRNEDGSIEGAECYMPFYTKKMFANVLVDVRDKQGNVIGQKLDVNRLSDDLKKMVGFRIPTEAHYSMLPLIIKDFLPQQNGSSIMLPADITQIAGEDFDIDGRFLFIPESRLENYDFKKAFRDFKKSHSVNNNGSLAQADKDGVLSSLLEELQGKEKNEEQEETFKEWFNANKEDYKLDKPRLKKVRYNMNKSSKENSRAARNNMLIDLGFAVLTARETAEKINSPGNFDKAKAEARRADILNDITLIDAYMKDRKITKLSDVNSKLFSESLEYLDKFLSKYKEEKNPLTVDTFIYNHHQNTTGGKLIGIYANNNTAHAKFQATHLGIAEKNQFKMDGVVFNSLSLKTININGIDVSILMNCAQLSAASVDNVKDPILASLLQNENTASIGGTMLAMGMSLKQMGVMMTSPFVRNFIENGFGINDLKILENQILEYCKRFNLKLDSIDNNITSKEIADSILYYKRIDWNNITSSNIESIKIEDKNVIDILKSSLEAANRFLNIAKIARDYSDLIRISRADSPNGAMKRSIAQTTNQLHNVDRFQVNSNKSDFTLVGTEDCVKNNVVSLEDTEDELRRKLNSKPLSMLQAFHSLGIDLGSSLESKVFIQLSDSVKEKVNILYKNSAYNSLSDSLLEKFYSDLTKFTLSKTKMFGNDENRTFTEKRDYYLYKFPKKFIEIKLNPKYKEIANIGIIKKLSVKKGKIVMENSGKITGTLREIYMGDFERLLYMDNPYARQFATDLLSYSFYLDGLNFGPRSYGNFFSTIFLNSFPELIDALTDMNSNINTNMYSDYMNQFYANYWNESGLLPSYFPKETPVKDTDGAILIPKTICTNKNVVEEDYYPLIVVKNSNPITGDIVEELYKYDETLDTAKAKRYYPVKVHNPNQGVKYDANMTYQEMAEIETDKKLIDDNRALDNNNIVITGNTEEDTTGINKKDDNVPTETIQDDGGLFEILGNTNALQDLKEFSQLDQQDDEIQEFIQQGKDNTKEIKCS